MSSVIKVSFVTLERVTLVVVLIDLKKSLIIKENIEISEMNKAWKSFVSGNNAALSSVYKQTHSSLVFSAFFYLKDEEKAKDVVADVFRKLLEMCIEQRKKQLDGVDDKLDTFLKVIVKNKCLDILKVEKNRKTILNSIFTPFNRSNNEVSLINDDFKLMIETLPNRQREVLELHLKGFDNNEISESLDISYNTCRNTLSTSKKKIKELWTIFMT